MGDELTGRSIPQEFTFKRDEETGVVTMLHGGLYGSQEGKTAGSSLNG